MATICASLSFIQKRKTLLWNAFLKSSKIILPCFNAIHRLDENYLSTEFSPCQKKKKWNGKAFNLSIPISLKDEYMSICEFPVKHDTELSIFPLQFLVLRATMESAIEMRVIVLLYTNFENGPSHSLPLCLRQVLAYYSNSSMWLKQSIRHQHLPTLPVAVVLQHQCACALWMCAPAQILCSPSPPKKFWIRDLTGAQEFKCVNKYSRRFWCR